GEASPETYLAGLNPTHPAYAALKAELAKLDEGEPAVAFQPIGDGPTLRPGQQDDRIPSIRARLTQLGQLTSAVPEAVSIAPVGSEEGPLFGSAELASETRPEPEVVTGGSLLYDETLVAAIRSFQSSAGLRPDGIIGARTISAL